MKGKQLSLIDSINVRYDLFDELLGDAPQYESYIFDFDHLSEISK